MEEQNVSRDTQRAAEGKGCEPERTTKSLLDKWTLVNKIVCDPELTPAAKVVATNLMWRMNCRWQTCFPKQTTIAIDTGLSERTIRDAIVALRDRGWLSWSKRPDSQYEYRFNWDADPGTCLDRHIPQEPPAKTAGDEEHSPEKSAGGSPAKTAALIEHGKDITREGSSHLSTPSASRDGPIEEKPLSSAEQDHDRRQAAAPEKPALQEGSPEWWKNRVWNETGVRFKEMFFPTISVARFKSRLGETIRRQQHDIPAVDRAMREAITAQPGGDAWEYVTGILRGKAERAPDYSQPLKARGVM